MVTFLRSSEAERLRQIEIERRLLPLHTFVGAVTAVGIVLVFFFFPLDRALQTLAVALVVWPAGLYGVWRMPRSAYPLLWLALQDLCVAAALSFGVSWSGGLVSPILPVLLLTVLMVGARYRGFALAAVMALVWAVTAMACAVGTAATLPRAPLHAIAWTGVFIAAAVVTSMLAGSERSARSEAVADPLTGLLNRKALELRLAELQLQFARSSSPIGVITCDLDGFKAVNDTYGHQAGDGVLQDVAEALRESLGDPDLLYRLGGDEFVVLLPHKDADVAAALAERLREGVERRRPGGYALTVSVGVAGGPGPHEDLGALIAQADRALYDAKAAGRNVVHTTRWKGPLRDPGSGVEPRLSDAA